jgi:electron transfer flavoprotein alpha subunit
MVEELATVLGAATACSKPVSDLDGDLTENT